MAGQPGPAGTRCPPRPRSARGPRRDPGSPRRSTGPGRNAGPAGGSRPGPRVPRRAAGSRPGSRTGPAGPARRSPPRRWGTPAGRGPRQHVRGGRAGRVYGGRRRRRSPVEPDIVKVQRRGRQPSRPPQQVRAGHPRQVRVQPGGHRGQFQPVLALQPPDPAPVRRPRSQRLGHEVIVTLPGYHAPEYRPRARRSSATCHHPPHRADAFIFVIPEYNYGFDAATKNAIDYLHHEWHYKPAGFASYGGVAAGTRAVQMLKQVLTTLKVTPVFEAVNIPFVQQFLDAPGTAAQRGRDPGGGRDAGRAGPGGSGAAAVAGAGSTRARPSPRPGISTRRPSPCASAGRTRHRPGSPARTRPPGRPARSRTRSARSPGHRPVPPTGGRAGPGRRPPCRTAGPAGGCSAG